MRTTLNIALSLLLLAVFPSYAEESAPARPNLDPEQILRQLVPEVPDIKMVTPEDMEPNPQGKYRRHAFIQGDFNKDGREDVAICATDEWIKKGISLTRNSYVLIASREKKQWVRVFLQRIDRLAFPFLIWDSERNRLLVGANRSDYEPGDIVWDLKEKKYKFVAPNK